MAVHNVPETYKKKILINDCTQRICISFTYEKRHRAQYISWWCRCNKNVIDHYGCCSMPRLELRRLAAVSLNYSLPAYFTIHMHLRYSKSLLYLLRRVIYISIKHSILQTLFICRLSNLTDPRPLNLGLCNKARCLDPVNTQVVGAAFRKRILIFLSSTPPTTAEI